MAEVREAIVKFEEHRLDLARREVELATDRDEVVAMPDVGKMPD